nr:glycosyltransferase family 4 protein [Thiorhodovibrio winogradskyi]
MGVTSEPLDSGQCQRSQEVRARYRCGAGPLLIFVGRLIEEKGAADLIQATAQLRADYPNIRSLILGDGPERQALEQFAAVHSVRDQVHFAGWIDPAEIPVWLNAADIFVGPSRTAANGWVEAQGLTFIEAMMARLPVIASRLGGIPDAVIHEHTGLLVDERAPDQIAAAVHRLTTEPSLAKCLANKAYHHATIHFSRAASARAFDVLFRQLMSRRKRDYK